MSLIQNKKVRNSLIFYLIFSILFWIIIFIVTPNYLRFIILPEDIKNLHITGNRKNMICEDNYKTFLNDYNYSKKMQDNIGYSIVIYGAIGYAFLAVNSEAFMERRYFLLLMLLYFIIFLVANIYYNYYWEPFGSITYGVGKNEFNLYFFFIKAMIPIAVVYKILGKLYGLIFKDKPELVGKYDWYEHPVKWIFTTIVLIIGLLIGYWIPWF